MNSLKSVAIRGLALIFTGLIALPLAGKEKEALAASPGLYKNIAMQDSMMFAAFNAQDLTRLRTFFSTDLEWFQDNAGLLKYDSVFANFENNFSKGLKLERKLVKGSLEIYPIKDYGAIETGIHKFRHTENGKEIVGTFKFLMIWKQVSDSIWVVTRVASYDH